MKLKENLILRQVADAWVVLALTDATINFDGMLTMNESGAMLWRALEQGGDREMLADTLTKEYDVERSLALEDVDAFLGKLKDAGCLSLD